MPSTRNGVQLAAAGGVVAKGILGATLAWKGISGTARTGAVIQSWNLGTKQDRADTKGPLGQFLSRRVQNTRLNLRVTLHVNDTISGGGAQTIANAFVVAEDPIDAAALVTVSNATNTLLNHAYWMVDSDAEEAETPEGEATITIDIVCFLDDQRAVIPLSAISA